MTKLPHAGKYIYIYRKNVHPSYVNLELESEKLMPSLLFICLWLYYLMHSPTSLKTQIC